VSDTDEERREDNYYDLIPFRDVEGDAFYAVIPGGLEALAKKLEAAYLVIEADGSISYVREDNPTEWFCYPSAEEVEEKKEGKVTLLRRGAAPRRDDEHTPEEPRT